MPPTETDTASCTVSGDVCSFRPLSSGKHRRDLCCWTCDFPYVWASCKTTTGVPCRSSRSLDQSHQIKWLLCLKSGSSPWILFIEKPSRGSCLPTSHQVFITYWFFSNKLSSGRPCAGAYWSNIWRTLQSNVKVAKWIYFSHSDFSILSFWWFLKGTVWKKYVFCHPRMTLIHQQSHVYSQEYFKLFQKWSCSTRSVLMLSFCVWVCCSTFYQSVPFMSFGQGASYLWAAATNIWDHKFWC